LRVFNALTDDGRAIRKAYQVVKAAGVEPTLVGGADAIESSKAIKQLMAMAEEPSRRSVSASEREAPMATPPVPPQPPLEDPLHEREIFASEIAGVGAVHGNIAVTLATVRFDAPIGSETPKARRVITGRLILTNAATGQLIQSLQKLATQIQAATAPTAGKEPNRSA